MKIAIDAMGGDNAPDEIVLGAIQAIETVPCEIILVGDENKIAPILAKYGEKVSSRITIHHTDQVIEMCESPGNAVRRKKDASIVVATRLVHDGVCQAVISAGNTGAAVAAALFGMGRIKGIERPAIATPIPSLKGTTILLDSGANVDSKPKHLVQNAVMGSIYAKYVFGIENPSVGLLSIGEEDSKGNEQTLATLPLLKKIKCINFTGNVEGRDIPKGTVDIVVCDGFVGNIVLKLGEGLASTIMYFVKDAIKNSGFLAKIASLAILPALKKLKKKLDYAEYGGALLLGVNGGCIICHGSSNAKAIKNAVDVAHDICSKKVIEHIKECIEKEGNIINGENT